MAEEATTIQLKKSVVEELKGIRRYPRETYNDTITELIRIAVKGMLPKSSLGRQMLQKLKIYAGPDHPHEAQKPVPLEI